MSDLVLATFQTASFRGVDFLFKNNKQVGGRKYKIFEYPNLDQRFVQDLGTLQRTYHMTATIADPSFNYQNSKFELIKALETEGPGVLVHPTDGVKTVFAMPYTLDEDISYTGTAIFTLIFVETGPQLFPNQSPSANSTIANIINNFISIINANFNSLWKTFSQFQGNIQFSADLIQSTVDQFKNAGNLVSSNVTAINNFTEEVSSLEDNKYTLAQDADGLSTNIADIFFEAGELGESTTDNLLIMQSMFAYSGADPVNQITVPTAQREVNRIISNQLMNAQSLAYYYLFMVNTEFDNEDDINEQKEITNNQFFFIINANSYTNILGNSSQILNNETLDLLEELRINANDALDAQLATARKVIETNIGRGSLLSIVFDYYGDVDLYDDIFELNNLTSPANLSGTLKLLSNVGEVNV